MKAKVNIQVGKAPSLHLFHTRADAMLLDHISHELPVLVVNLWYVLGRPLCTIYNIYNCSVEKDIGMGLGQYVDLCFHALSLPCLHTFWGVYLVRLILFRLLLGLSTLFSSTTVLST